MAALERDLSQLSADELQAILLELASANPTISQVVNSKVSTILGPPPPSSSTPSRSTSARPPASGGRAPSPSPIRSGVRTPTSASGSRSRPRTSGEDGGRPRTSESMASTRISLSPSSRPGTASTNFSSITTMSPVKSFRFNVFKNGYPEGPGKPVSATSRAMFLRYATEKLQLSKEAARIFDVNGAEVFDLGTLWQDAKVFVSTGEGFRSPSNPTPWVTLDEEGRRATIPREITQAQVKDISKVRVEVRHLGSGLKGKSMQVVARSKGKFNVEEERERFLSDATRKLKLPQTAHFMYDDEGNELRSTRWLQPLQTIYIAVTRKAPNVEAHTVDPLPWVPKHAHSNRRVTTEDEDYFSRDPKLAGHLGKRVYVQRNGTPGVPEATIVIRPERAHIGPENSLQLFLDDATSRLDLPANATRAFHDDGVEIHKPSEVTKGEVVYISMGEPFKPPNDKWQHHTEFYTKDSDRGLDRYKRRLLNAVVNGDQTKVTRRVVAPAPKDSKSPAECIAALLETCTETLDMNKAARRIFWANGVELTPDTYFLLEAGDEIRVSKGEDYRVIGQALIEVYGGNDPLTDSVTAALQEDSRLTYTLYSTESGHPNGARHVAFLEARCGSSEVPRVFVGGMSLGNDANTILRVLEDRAAIYHLVQTAKDLPWAARVSDGAAVKYVTPAGGAPRMAAAVTKALRVQVFKNGQYLPGTGRPVVGASMADLLNNATTALALTYNVRKFFTPEGIPVKDFDSLQVDAPLIASMGEPFQSATAAIDRAARDREKKAAREEV